MLDDMAPEDEWLIGDEEFQKAFEADLASLLNLETWKAGFDVERTVDRCRQVVARAVGEEQRILDVIREQLLPRLPTRRGAPGGAGVYPLLPDCLAAVQEALLFSGRVEAVRSLAVSHDSLPLGITQLGVAMVSYGGNTGTFSQRLFRREVSARSQGALQEALNLFRQRHRRSEVGGHDHLSKLARRGIRAYAERAVLVDEAQAEWRIGCGNPCPEELLSGSGYAPLLEASLDMLRRLIRHKKFVFVSERPMEQGYMTLGHALAPGQYAIIDTLEHDSLHVVDRWEYGGRSREKALAFVEECCPQVLIGLFRASEHRGPQLFYAHREFVHVAAWVALADSVLRPQVGFPMLLDVAYAACRGAFAPEGFLGLVQEAYSQAGANLHYFSGRNALR